MKNIIVIFLTLFLTGCGAISPIADLITKHNPKNEDPRGGSGVHSDFQYYVTGFENELGSGIGDIPIYYASQKNGIVGMCIVWSSGEKEIQIDKTYWSNASDDERERLIYHELGHCRLNINGHRDGVLSDSCPKSVMNTYTFSDVCYNNHYNYYIKELFGK